jgi:hypothetical protein
VGALAHAAPDHVDITWMSIANMHFDLGERQILADGYITRLPQELFFGGGGGLRATRQPMLADEAAVRQVFDAIGGKHAVKLLLTGHSHFDHSFDRNLGAALRRADHRISHHLPAGAQQIPSSRCRPVYGGERIALGDGIALYVIRWNHSGDSGHNPEQHDPIELTEVRGRIAVVRCAPGRQGFPQRRWQSRLPVHG